MIMFTSKSNRIFAQVIDDYHRCDDVDAPVRNPYANGSIEYLLYLKTGSIRCSGIWRISSAIRISIRSRR